MPHEHTVTDGYTTLTREGATPQDLFDLAHDLLDRVDGLEWALAALSLITMRHLDMVGDPGEEVVNATIEGLQDWLAQYREDRERIKRDREFLGMPE